MVDILDVEGVTDRNPDLAGPEVQSADLIMLISFGVKMPTPTALSLKHCKTDCDSISLTSPKLGCLIGSC